MLLLLMMIMMNLSFIDPNCFNVVFVLAAVPSE